MRTCPLEASNSENLRFRLKTRSSAPSTCSSSGSGCSPGAGAVVPPDPGILALHALVRGRSQPDGTLTTREGDGRCVLDPIRKKNDIFNAVWLWKGGGLGYEGQGRCGRGEDSGGGGRGWGRQSPFHADEPLTCIISGSDLGRFSDMLWPPMVVSSVVVGVALCVGSFVLLGGEREVLERRGRCLRFLGFARLGRGENVDARSILFLTRRFIPEAGKEVARTPHPVVLGRADVSRTRRRADVSLGWFGVDRCVLVGGLGRGEVGGDSSVGRGNSSVGQSDRGQLGRGENVDARFIFFRTGAAHPTELEARRHEENRLRPVEDVRPEAGTCRRRRKKMSTRKMIFRT